MVEFNGAAFEDISPKIKVIDVVVGAPNINTVSIVPAIADGERFARRNYGSRNVVIQFVVMEADETERTKILSEIEEWAYSKQEQKLIVPQDEDGYLMAICSQIPDDDAREFWNVLTLTFKAHNPYFRAHEESSAVLGDPFIVKRAAGADWRIEQNISELVELPSWEFGDKQISFSYIAAGNLVLDKETQTALLDGESILPSMLFGSRFFELSHGENVIEVQNGAGGTIYWRERWI